jgi:hypothetical protein
MGVLWVRGFPHLPTVNVVESSVDYRLSSRLSPMSISVLITQQLLELRGSPQQVLLKLLFVQVKVAPHAHSPLVYLKPASVSKSHFPHLCCGVAV